MKNYEIEAAWKYHNGTKHPNGQLLSNLHTYNPARRPIPYKRYKNASRIKLAPEKTQCSMTALEAIGNSCNNETDFIVDMPILSKILFFSGGITKRIRFPTLGEVDFRAASCTGALYHIEMYVVCAEIPGLAAGIYHFDPENKSLDILRMGDYRNALANATADDPFVSRSPVTIAFTDIFSRNSIKYQAREYRHAFWDCGTMLSNSLAVSAAHKTPYKLILGFVDSKINGLLSLDDTKEATLALLSLGQSDQQVADLPPLGEIPQVEPVKNDIDFPAINEMHESSCLIDLQEVSKWKVRLSAPSQPALNQINLADNLEAEESLEQTIMKRGSTRRFSHEPVSFEQLSTILNCSTKNINSDFEDGIISDIYLIVNSVDGLEQGAYFYHKENNSLVTLKKGNLRDVSGHLGLDQNLPYDAAVTIFFMVDLENVLEKLGNRGYRAAQIDSSIIAGKMYLAAYALKIGATGLTFYDDEVTEFLSPHASNKSVMFMLAIGKKARDNP